jgi:shikimate dehydrogenase
VNENGLTLIDNRAGLEIAGSRPFAAIVGESPSRGARSPALWNAAFRAAGIPGAMHAFDVRRENLAGLVEALREDERFIGGAVAVPYKQDIGPLLDDVEPEGRTIGAVNCIYRRGRALVGANTDGAGFLAVLEGELGSGYLAGRCAVVLGAGGAGRAVATYLAGAVGRGGSLVVGNRTVSRRVDLADRLRAYTKAEVSGLPVKGDALEDADVVVNCTSVGFDVVRIDDAGAYTLRPYTPLAEIDERLRVPPGDQAARRYMIAARHAVLVNLRGAFETLARVGDRTVVCDIVYQPRQTALLHAAGSFGLRTIDGLRMNLEQAVIAFDKAVRGAGLARSDTASVRAAMLAA